jgi:hypothetical protein
VSVVDHAGRPVKTSQTRDGRHLFIEFAGHGRYAASVPLPKAGTLRRGLGAAAT